MHLERAGPVTGRLIAAFFGLCVVAGTACATRADSLEPPLPGPEIAPVPRLFEQVHASFSGRILRIELELADPPFYEVKLLTENGNVLMLSYNAMTLRLDSVVGHRDIGDEKVTGVRLEGDRDDADDAGDDRDDDDDDAEDDRDAGGDDGRGGAGDDDDDDSGGGNSGPGGGDDDDDDDDDDSGGSNSGPGGGDGDDNSGGGNSGPGGGGSG